MKNLYEGWAVWMLWVTVVICGGVLLIPGCVDYS